MSKEENKKEEIKKEEKVTSKKSNNVKNIKKVDINSKKENKQKENKQEETKAKKQADNKKQENKSEKNTKAKENVKETKEQSKENEKINNKKDEKKITKIKNNENTNKENSSYNKKRMIYILIGILLILIALLMYSNLILHRNSPKGTVNNYFKLLRENPNLAFEKYGETDFEKKLKKEKIKYLQYKVLSERKTNKKSQEVPYSDIYEVEISVKNTDPRAVSEKTDKKMEEFKYKEGTKEYMIEYLKQYTKINKEESKNMKEIKNSIYVAKDPLTSKYVLVDSRSIKK